MNIDITNEWRTFRRCAKNMLKSFLTGLYRLVRLIILLLVWIVTTGFIFVRGTIRKHPCAAVLTTFAVMIAVLTVHHMQMKTRITTAEYVKDSLSLCLDSITAEKTGTRVTYIPYNK